MNVSDASRLPALILTGPTACGKSALAVRLAQAMAAQRPVEIISVDSALVYRGMDIGTAKPTLDERGGVPHHLIDLLEPTQAYSAAQFVRDAQRLITEVHARGAFPLLVGGTLLYIKALQEGLDELPPADPAMRERLDALAEQHGLAHLHRRLADVDPVTAARLPPGDSQRIQRALEVFELTGRPISAFHQREARPPGAPLAYPMLSLEFGPDDRASLHQRITRRTQTMLDAGLIDEVRTLRARGDLTPDRPSMRCVGYRQVWQALEGEAQNGTPWTATGPDGTTLPQRIAAATRQLAKRQMTWLRGMPQRQVLSADPADADSSLQQALAVLARLMQLPRTVAPTEPHRQTP
ncbi:tRNA (adenosine(37)-N6)-dimethylallyltransferase MiaA [Amphibiibacter pelophylacis]|uniref:tRNA (Adenosine(37)-N6)-dimethylallyltransferase MiaA n=1 Tax=Amphibiibacter pelophylacis TaxID=1799477 RepID=A0ACC6P387_9BURK